MMVIATKSGQQQRDGRALDREAQVVAGLDREFVDVVGFRKGGERMVKPVGKSIGPQS